MDRPRLYSDLADWWTLLSPVEEYGEEAALFKTVLLDVAPARPRTLLELGSGGGNNAYHLKADFDMTLVDASVDMIRQSRKINPELPHVHGDMRNVRLGRTFDAIFIHDAIEYMVSRQDLALALATAFVHCRPGGAALFVPDHTKERFTAATSCGGRDEGPRGMRYLEWSWDPDPADDTAVSDFAFLLRDETGLVQVVHDRHLHGLFARHVWLDTIAAAGFEPQGRLCEHSDVESGYELFIGVKS